MSQEKKTKYREVGTHLLCYKGRIHFDVYKVEFYLFLFSVRLQDLISRREAQEESHPKAADSGAYSCKHTLALQQPDWKLFIFQYLQKLINHWNSLLQWSKVPMKIFPQKGHRIMKKWLQGR